MDRVSSHLTTFVTMFPSSVYLEPSSSSLVPSPEMLFATTGGGNSIENGVIPIGTFKQFDMSHFYGSTTYPMGSILNPVSYFMPEMIINAHLSMRQQHANNNEFANTILLPNEITNIVYNCKLTHSPLSRPQVSLI